MTVTVVALYGYKHAEQQLKADSFTIDDENGQLSVFKDGHKVAAYAAGSWASVVSS